ncbi:uncharacterized protein B0T15DRAFT_571699 [Chaetomium strumarium]|uniref:Uncharacterized protein n=1 Tax=Chaetomium strumarium TaxID=1170767 RepID=A0AAJ0H4C2_9PEZI|nr:hypothetical protein B0T15DRAFT_571699 [Chaetomium strumarium]
MAKRSSLKHRPATGEPTLEPLGEGPTIRSKGENDEYIQSWLQQTQNYPSRAPDPDHREEWSQMLEHFRHKAHADRRRKRSRSPLVTAPASPKTAEPAEHRFEKRARHKTRDDKYDYKTPAGQKLVSSKELRERGRRGTIKVRDKETRKGHPTRHGDSDVMASHKLEMGMGQRPKHVGSQTA